MADVKVNDILWEMQGTRQNDKRGELMAKNNVGELLKLMVENPDLPIIPMVDTEVVADDCSSYWIGSWGRCEVTEYYIGRERVHFKDDDMEDVLVDMVECMYGKTEDVLDIRDDLSDEDWKELFNSLPWIKAIVVYIETPE